MATMQNNYAGEIQMANGKKIKFSVHGTTKLETEKLLREAHPKMKIKLERRK
jgi:hypothetical protein